MSDVLTQYAELKARMKEISVALFNILEENDKFKMIALNGLTNAVIEEVKDNENLVDVALHDYTSANPYLISRMTRESVMNLDYAAIVKQWEEACAQTIERTNTAKIKKFVKDFGVEDFELIQLALDHYEYITERNGKTDHEAAKIIAGMRTEQILKEITNESNGTA